jgi:hypothetical protein
VVQSRDYQPQESEAVVIGQPWGHLVPDTYGTGDDNDLKCGDPNAQPIRNPYDEYGHDTKEGYAY